MLLTQNGTFCSDQTVSAYTSDIEVASSCMVTQLLRFGMKPALINLLPVRYACAFCSESALVLFIAGLMVICREQKCVFPSYVCCVITWLFHLRL